MKLSLHDNTLLSYTVDCRERRIVLRTAYLNGSAAEHTEVVFEGVLAYLFENDTFGTILFDIEEVPVGDLFREHQDQFTRLQNYGWPAVNRAGGESVLEAALRLGAKGFEITSSCGLFGWVWAREMQVRSAAQ
jgi:hypothetical protein